VTVFSKSRTSYLLAAFLISEPVFISQHAKGYTLCARALLQ